MLIKEIMETTQQPKPMRVSRIQLAQMMQPEHANSQGNVHGGWIMKLVDEAGALASTRHAANRTVTVAIDQMVFRQPIHIGDLVFFNAEVTYAGHTSMEVEVDVIAENPITGHQTHTNAAFLVYVAIDEHEKPTSIPPLLAETPAEQARMDAARQRQKRRLAQKANR
jgi:acyl-CoA hydrolase